MADPATFLVSNRVLGPDLPLRTVCLFSCGKDKRRWVWISSPHLQSAPSMFNVSFTESHNTSGSAVDHTLCCPVFWASSDLVLSQKTPCLRTDDANPNRLVLKMPMRYFNTLGSTTRAQKKDYFVPDKDERIWACAYVKWVCLLQSWGQSACTLSAPSGCAMIRWTDRLPVARVQW